MKSSILSSVVGVVKMDLTITINKINLFTKYTLTDARILNSKKK